MSIANKWNEDVRMFRLKVDDEINLVLVNERLALSIAEQVKANLEYLSQWLP